MTTPLRQVAEALHVLLTNAELGEYESQRQGKPRMIEAREQARAALDLPEVWAALREGDGT